MAALIKREPRMRTAHRDILHVDIDAFFAGVELACDPELAGRPVIVCGDPSGRSVVSSASYEARARGIRPAMPLARARKLCPGATFIGSDFGKYRRFASGLFEILGNFTPDVEPLSIDEAYLDLTGCRSLQGHVFEAAGRIRSEIKRELNLDASIGIGATRLVARIASAMAKPKGILRVIPGQEKGFLSHLPVGAIPGVGTKLGGRLNRLGVRTVGELSRIDPELLSLMFGKTGVYLHLASRGRGPAPASPPRGRKSISREITFARDTADRISIDAALSLLIEKAGGRLRELGRLAGGFTVKLRYSDFVTVTRASRLAPPTDIDRIIFRAARARLDSAYARRLKLRMIGISLTRLHYGTLRPSLFDEYNLNKYKKIYDAVDKIRKKYDFAAVLSARSLQGLKVGKKNKQ